MPDIDVFFGWVPWAPLAMHRGFTHGLVGGVLVMPPLLAGLLWLLDRWQVKRGATFKSGLAMHFGWLVALCYIGAITHPLLDLQTTYSVQLLSPFSDAWFHADSLFIIDVWLWLRSRSASRCRAGARRRAANGSARCRPRWRSVVAYIALNTAAQPCAPSAPRRERAGGAPRRRSSPRRSRCCSGRRELIWREAGAIGRARFDPVRGVHAVEPAIRRQYDDAAGPLRARADAERARLPALVDPADRDDRAIAVPRDVSIGDARFGDRGSARASRARSTCRSSGAGCR